MTAANAFALHGVGGLVGSLLVAVFMSADFGGIGYPDGGGIGGQLLAQLIGLGAVGMWSILGTLDRRLWHRNCHADAGITCRRSRSHGRHCCCAERR